MSSSSSSSADFLSQPLQGAQLIGAGMLLAAANFIAVLDTTIANVSVSTISGALVPLPVRALTSSPR